MWIFISSHLHRILERKVADMTEHLTLLPSTTYQPPMSAPVRSHGMALNTIMEEGLQKSNPGLRLTNMPERPTFVTQSSQQKIANWLSPMSDHFPTPRGFHFMSAPILPESPSTSSIDEGNSPSASFSQNSWNRMSASTVVTEFDDIYDVSDDEGSRKSMRRTSSFKRHNSSRSMRRTLTPLTIPEEHDVNPTESWSGRPDMKKKLTSPVPITPSHKVEMSPAVMSFMQAQQIHEIPTISAPPSLDGSLTSEQLATMSAPPTPII